MRQQCEAVKKNGDRCKAKAIEGEKLCTWHDPETQRKVAILSIEEINEWFWVFHEREKKAREACEDLEKRKNALRKAVEIAGNISRLDEIFQVAKEKKDAATMESVNRAMYFAKRNMLRNEDMRDAWESDL